MSARATDRQSPARPAMTLVRLDQVNQMSLDDFSRTFAGLFQDVPWAVERAYQQRPFSDTDDLRSAFQEAMFGATPDEQLELLQSYPDLGATTLSQAESHPRPVRAGPEPDARRGLRGVRGAEREVPGEVRFPLSWPSVRSAGSRE